MDLSMQDIFGQDLKQDRLHFVLVDRGIPLTVALWIPSIQCVLRVYVKEDDDMESFLPTIKAKYPILEEVNFAFYKTPYNKREELLGTTTKDQPFPGFTVLFSAFDDIPFSKFPCVPVEVVQPERKHELSWENAERATKHRKPFYMAPSSIGPRHYHSVQAKSTECLLDFRRPTNYTEELIDRLLPPIEVLFHGFGEFLEIWRAASMSNFKPDSTELDMRVEDFVNSMSLVYTDEGLRRTEGLKKLNLIFPPTDRRDSIAPGEVSRKGSTGSPPRTDGHSLFGHLGIPCIIVEFKNESGGSTAIPIAELVAYYARMVENIATDKAEVVNGSRLPTLGITIVGNTITFFGLAYVGSPLYVPLTTTHWCLPVESGGSDRYQLYTAFKAASVLLASIVEEAKRLTDSSPPPIKRPFLPQLNRLTKYHDPSSPPLPAGDSTYIDFQITEVVAKDFNQHIYLASSSTGSGDLVIKLTRSYAPELHSFCAGHHYAPKLYACEKLAGGIFAVAMEYITGEPLTCPAPAHLRNKLIDDLENMVKTMHDKDYVHGDLRPPNFLCVEDGIKVLDFDWGGKVGEVRYPHTRLHPQLRTGRDMSRLEITKEDDIRVLKVTLDYVKGQHGAMEE
ncbi:hypothetical protein V8E55_004117 [Tylopilus felleus]